eukprot:5714873-Prorocentrum_lima.AAC.1
MTSSLVGSEMCIRDRERRWPKKAPSSPRGALPMLPSSFPSHAHAHFLSCLLYTSDAADDM